MWIALIGCMILLVLGGILYLTFRSTKFAFVQKLSGGRKWLSRLICFVFYLALAGLLWAVWNLMNALVCLIHLLLFWILCDVIAWIISKLRRRRPRFYWAGLAAAVLCVLYLAWGWYSLHHVRQQSYTLETPKSVGSIRIIQIADSHLGTALTAKELSDYIDEISQLSPDVIVVTGDFVDDDTPREEMLAGCDALGRARATYGVFFVFGNHDKGYYSESARGWTNRELYERLQKNGVFVLEDEVRLINDRFYIVGRKDRSEEQRSHGRVSAEELLHGLDPDHYIVILDHQPYDFDGEASAGADLVLCGHTHGGQFIPINHVGEWIGENALVYGLGKRQGTNFIVTSGISNWAFQFKTGCWSEYVVIDINQK
ncbi:MAG: metallophosphoesterase [Firmicutes bacterium]|nr:metallophosphoesterase [Bacillota bacterium]